MSARLAYVFPGQGSQSPGMGRELVAEYVSAREVFDEADEALGFALSKLCFEGRAQELLQGVAQAGVPLKAAPVPLPQPFPMDHRLMHASKSLPFSPLNCYFCLDKCYSSVII